MIDVAFAPAKVNLFLHVGLPAVAGGDHPVASLMVFADVGDTVRCEPAAAVTLTVEGEFASALAASSGGDNLVTWAVRALLARASHPGGAALTLVKALPIAAGLGGGSSDAGAALRLVRRVLNLNVDDAALSAIAAELGADGPACLGARPVLGLDRGDRLAPVPALPVLDAVLVNPRAPCPTGAVYRAYDAEPSAQGVEGPPLPKSFPTTEEVISFLQTCRNDLEPTAARLVPAVREVLALIRAQPQTRLGRLSGSGATAFALCGDALAADALAVRLAALRPDWWVRVCKVGGRWPDALALEPVGLRSA